MPLLLKLTASNSDFDCRICREGRGQEATDRCSQSQQMQPYSFAATVDRESSVPPKTRTLAVSFPSGSSVSKGMGFQQSQTAGSESVIKLKLMSSFPILTSQAGVAVRGQGMWMPVRTHSSAALHSMHIVLPCGLQLTDLHLPSQSVQAPVERHSLPSDLIKATASCATHVSNLHSAWPSTLADTVWRNKTMGL